MQLNVEHNLTDDQLRKALSGMAVASSIIETLARTGTSPVVYVVFDNSKTRNIQEILTTRTETIKHYKGYLDKNGVACPAHTRAHVVGQATIIKMCSMCGKLSMMPPHKAALLKTHPHKCAPCINKERQTGQGNKNFNGGTTDIHCSLCGAPKAMRPYERKKYLNRKSPYKCKVCYDSARPAGADSATWMGGRTREPYPQEFNKKLRAEIRKRDEYTCQICGEHQRKDRRLDVHHIDYHKNNLSKSNLISLCNSCHKNTNFGRKSWQALLSLKIQALKPTTVDI